MSRVAAIKIFIALWLVLIPISGLTYDFRIANVGIMAGMAAVYLMARAILTKIIIAMPFDLWSVVYLPLVIFSLLVFAIIKHFDEVLTMPFFTFACVLPFALVLAAAVDLGLAINRARNEETARGVGEKDLPGINAGMRRYLGRLD